MYSTVASEVVESLENETPDKHQYQIRLNKMWEIRPLLLALNKSCLPLQYIISLDAFRRRSQWKVDPDPNGDTHCLNWGKKYSSEWEGPPRVQNE